MYLIVSFTIVAASTTVGTPIAITGISNVSLDISSLLFPTPLPGDIPASVIWIVLLTWSKLELAKLSIAITISGLISLTIPFIMFWVSIPVVPVTPGSITDILLNPSSNSPNSYKLLVTIILRATNGPMESGVHVLFPNPTIRT